LVERNRGKAGKSHPKRQEREQGGNSALEGTIEDVTEIRLDSLRNETGKQRKKHEEAESRRLRKATSQKTPRQVNDSPKGHFTSRKMQGKKKRAGKRHCPSGKD